ncbi:hypothetical protein GOBAR_AA26435 [Gossypium barbadense]|uniref:Uncharacterized protein n=1 Tax=Gossypium barbadense TaxID=3634 RepID=A0A2P5WT23_GOSBA|nr:hypothetical protein GOBAR_AA26435 [Gossypium barbadense]
MPIFIGHVGAHSRVARSCPASFASPTLVLISHSRARVVGMGESHAGVNFSVSTTAMSHGRGNVSNLVLGKTFALY